jgi:hypothetical protein
MEVASLRCRSCKNGRYAPPLHMIRLTKQREIAPYAWVHPDDDALISKQFGSRRRDAVQSIRHQIIVASQDALDVECRRGGRVGISIVRANGPMTAIIYFGEMLVASLLAILLLAISPLRMSSDAVLFGGGVVAWTLAEYVVGTENPILVC